MPISVESRPRLTGIAAPLRDLVTAALALEGRRPGAITVLLTDDAALRALNQRWRGLDRATDVLSFVYDARRGRVNGDLAISLERMRQQARRYRVTPGRELARLAVHGALHLAGLDHARPGERLHMRRREQRALRMCAASIRALDRALGRP
jgi:probable rRNA maturation factor